MGDMWEPGSGVSLVLGVGPPVDRWLAVYTGQRTVAVPGLGPGAYSVVAVEVPGRWWFDLVVRLGLRYERPARPDDEVMGLGAVRYVERVPGRREPVGAAAGQEGA